MAIDHHPAIHDPGVQVRTHQPDNADIVDTFFEPADQGVVIDPVNELGQVEVAPLVRTVFPWNE